MTAEALIKQLPTRQDFSSTEIVEHSETAATAVAAQSKALVESRYIMALRMPRNWDQVRQDLIKECSRPSFAHDKSALYIKPIGEGVEGLGIRFAEVAVRCMKNVFINTTVTYDNAEKRIINVSVTDLEANLCYDKTISVAKTVERSKPLDDGSYISVRLNSYKKPVFTIPATDDDLLNKEGALISKAIRSLVIRLVPGDLQDECEKIIKKIRLDKAAKDPDAERKAIVDAFATLNIKVTDLEEYLEHPLDNCTPTEIVDLRGLYGALKDGEATWATVMENKRETKKPETNGDSKKDEPAKPKSKVETMKNKIAEITGKKEEASLFDIAISHMKKGNLDLAKDLRRELSDENQKKFDEELAKLETPVS